MLAAFDLRSSTSMSPSDRETFLVAAAVADNVKVIPDADDSNAVAGGVEAAGLPRDDLLHLAEPHLCIRDDAGPMVETRGSSRLFARIAVIR